MDFTVIIPSRNRPVLLRKAIDSVLMQSHPSVEILVVNDGSDGENEQAYALLANELQERVRFLNLEKAKNGHGQSGSINRGADAAQGAYLCFLDDDDYWTDPDHLKRAHQCIGAHSAAVDIYLSNQNAFLNDVPVTKALWLESLQETLPKQAIADSAGALPVTVSDLMKCSGFGHLNTTIVRKAIYTQIKGMDENIRYECDLDFYLRIIDAAAVIRYYPGYTSRHNAPDPTQALNMSTIVSFNEKMLSRAYVWDKALLFARTSAIRETAIRSKAYTYKKIACTLVNDAQFKQGFYYARAALAGGTNLKWLAYCTYIGLRAAFSNR